jgi:Trk K+ transport system NAD-binding subunit
MTDIKTREGAHFTIDRDYMGSIGEDVQFRVWAGDPADPDIAESLTPDEADALAAALTHHAAEVRQINKELA